MNQPLMRVYSVGVWADIGTLSSICEGSSKRSCSAEYSSLAELRLAKTFGSPSTVSSREMILLV